MKKTLPILFICLSLAASAQKAAPKMPVKAPISDTTKIASYADIDKFIQAVRSQPHNKFVTFTVDDVLLSLVSYIKTLKP